MRFHVQRPPARTALVCAALLAVPALQAQDSRVVARLPQPAPQATTVAIPKIEYTDFTLANGLRVIVSEDHSSPVVAVEVWYNAGSKFDPPGKSGLAHMFEHLMDEGTLNMPTGEYRRVIQGFGGFYNASTQNDFTRYWSMAPSNQLETVLWLEAERMANLSPALDTTRFRLERDAVRNEYTSSVLSRPVMTAGESLFEVLFAGGAYGIPVIGKMSELNTATVEDLRRFYETYYIPNNAALIIVGDVKAADAKRMVEKHFGPIPRGAPVKFPVTTTPFSGEKRLVVEHTAVPGNFALWSVWRGAKSSSPDRPALLALSGILTERFRRLFVDDRRVATFVNSGTNQHFDLQDAGVFQVAITLAANASATNVEDMIDSVVASVKKEGVTDTEVRRWVGTYRLTMLTQMQADSMKSLNIGDATINQKNPLGIYEMTDRAQRVTPAQVQEAARTYLTADRVIITIVPPGKLEMISKPDRPYVNVTRKP
jgi:zinc protease